MLPIETKQTEQTIIKDEDIQVSSTHDESVHTPIEIHMN